jgi:cytochrome bd-type quinol oxidase subunit 2
MTWLKPVLWLVSLSFSAFSLWVLMQVGYLGIWQGGFANLGSTQITLDLVIACTLLLGFIVRDCRAQGRSWWPWAALTLVAGSIGPLAYLLWPRR